VFVLSLEMSEHPKDLVETEDGVPSNSGMCVWRYNDGWSHECDRVQGGEIVSVKSRGVGRGKLESCEHQIRD